MPQFKSFCTVTTSKLYMFIEQLQISITFSTCVIMLCFNFFYLKATQNFLWWYHGGPCGQFSGQYCAITI